MKQHNMCLGCVSPSLEGCTGADFMGAEFMQSRVGFFEEKSSLGLPWGLSSWESACQCRRHWFDPWSGKMPHAVGQLSWCATAVESVL